VGLRPPEIRARERLLDAYEAGLAAVDAEEAVRRALAELPGDVEGRVVVLAFGKAARGMARAALALLPVADGFVIDSSGEDLGALRGRPGGHPVPHPDAAAVGAEVLDFARSLGAADTALCLVSGGGSAMLELPARGHTLDELTSETERLLRAGVDIGVINARRAQLSRLKGGGLARAMGPATVINLVLSDVAPLGPEVVASGPTVAPGAVTRLVGDGLTAAQAAAHALGAEVCTTPLRGEARRLGAALIDGNDRVWFGEPHVTVRGSGRGGRCRELALGAIGDLRGGALLAAGTDGVDGPGGGAGAIVDAAVLRAAAELGLDADEALADNDSGSFFDAVGATVTTGPTGTNVADLVLYLSSSATATSPR